tara:strand:- start:8631 stop:8885 length:255 start_codon:yes stop_codon:yes gene_type:complete
MSLVSSFTFANSDVENRIHKLEQQIQQLQNKKVDASKCELKITGYTDRWNWCDKGSMMTGVRALTSDPSSLRVECAFYKIECSD